MLDNDRSWPALMPIPCLLISFAQSIYLLITSYFFFAKPFAYSSVYNSTLSGLILITDSNSSIFGSKKIEVLILFDLNSSTISFKYVSFFIVSQPAFEVSAFISSGTNVTWVGLISVTILTNLSIGFPSILNSLYTISFNS